MTSLRLALALLVLALRPSVGEAESSAEGWIYLRGGEPPASSERLVEVLAVGDVMPGRGLAAVPGIFDRVAETLQGADLTIGNLEGVLADGPPAATPSLLLLSQATPAALAQAGFDLISLANNHALDAGAEGLVETRRRLHAVGIESLDNVHAVIRQIDGLTFGFVAWNDLEDARQEDLMHAISAVRQKSDVVIVMVHWGQEYVRHPARPQRDLASSLLQAGADIVLGSHPHVVQDVQIVNLQGDEDHPRLVAYSLGNFIFDQGWDDTAQGLALRLLFDSEGLRAAQALPLWTAPRPRWMDPDDAAGLLERIIPPERIVFACSSDSCLRVAVPDLPQSGAFWSGAIDLTGDGVNEVIRRVGNGLEILEDGQAVWRSPPDWGIRDLALGDPNDDGRSEIMLALEKPGPSGATTSHPFILGYRGGVYRELWGGSAVHAPLVEVELGDVDGDGVEELAAIEAPADEAARYLTLWRWHGWGFSLVWRSPAGDYRDLIILPAVDGHPARLSVAVTP